jgi:hypothetical protein
MGEWSAAREQKIQYIYNVNEKECEFNERERNGMSKTCEDGGLLLICHGILPQPHTPRESRHETEKFG